MVGSALSHTASSSDRLPAYALDDRPPVDVARLGVGLLWGVPLSLSLWALIALLVALVA